MLSLFLNVKNRPMGSHASSPTVDGEANPKTGAEPAAGRVETAEDLTGLLSVIIANGEFLEVIYGENRHLKNILHAAGKAKRQLRNAHEKQTEQP